MDQKTWNRNRMPRDKMDPTQTIFINIIMKSTFLALISMTKSPPLHRTGLFLKVHSTPHPKKKWNNIVREKFLFTIMTSTKMILKSSLPGPSFVDWKRTDTAHNENLNENNKTKFTEKDSRHQVGAEKKELSIEYGN